MTSGQFDYHDLVMIPLTPIHVGGGDEAMLGLEDYRLKDGALERVDILKHALADRNSETLLRDLEKGMYRTFFRLQKRIPDKDVMERISISQVVAGELARTLESPGGKRQGKIFAFLRSGGYPTLPGSSLKGCLRTAWLDSRAKTRRLSKGDIGHGKSEQRSQRSRRLLERALEMDGKETALDPFRDVTVSDARLPEGATRVDMVSSWKFDNNQKAYAANPSGQIQLMRERMLAVADGGDPPLLPLRIGLRSGHVRERRRNATRDNIAPKRSPESIFELLSALEEHHAPLWDWEIKKFFSGNDQRLKLALGLFDSISRNGARPDAALIRIGWATHAEAKSVAEFREIHRPQFRGKRGEFAKEGSTRHVVNPSGEPFPFGWALLVLADVWQDTKDTISWLPEQRPPSKNLRERPSRGSSSSQRPTPKYRKGDSVRLDDGTPATLLEDASEGMTQVNVEIDRDIEQVNISKIEGLA